MSATGWDAVRSAAPSLVLSTQLVERGVRDYAGRLEDRRLAAPWVLKMFPDALEASVHFEYQYRPRSRSPGGFGEQPLEVREQRSKLNAARRASSRLRRYVVANRLNRLGTLTYAAACTDPRQVSEDVGGFFRGLRSEIGRPFPYVWVREWHPGGHGLHVHFLVGRFVRQSLIRTVWGRGIVDIRARGMQRLGEGAAAESRRAARYVAKYVSKASQEDRIPGLHRFVVAQGFQPKLVSVRAPNELEAMRIACEVMRGVPSRHWRPFRDPDWTGPLVVWMAWDR